ncbi:MAG: T9SS type A sorting domain-containing protein [Bacteroidetes bacterium]|nr:T9SS type A sorting domain-containing protein [Bacteroidota bacterium]
MKRITTLCLFLSFTIFASAQDFVEVNNSAGYADQTFYALGNNQSILANTDWDIALTAIGPADAGIHINEAAGISANSLALYVAPTDNFEDPITDFTPEEPLLNDELSWDYGAFNNVRDLGDPFDYGWGVYNPDSHVIEGTTVYVIRLRDDSYRKLFIESLSDGAYTIRHANFDGSDEQSITVSKSAASTSGLILLSLETGVAVSEIQAATDLIFTRYSTPIDDGSGNFLDYTTTGVLSAPGVLVAEAVGVDPISVDYQDYENDFQPELDIIGYDWKEFDLNTVQWTVFEDRAYFVKDADGNIYKIVFIDFEGSATGTTVFQEELVAEVTSVEDPSSAFNSINVFPNPATDYASLVYEIKQAAEVSIELYSIQGQQIQQFQSRANSGLNAIEFNTSNLAAGSYIVLVRTAGEVQQQLLNVQ